MDLISRGISSLIQLKYVVAVKRKARRFGVPINNEMTLEEARRFARLLTNIERGSDARVQSVQG